MSVLRSYIPNVSAHSGVRAAFAALDSIQGLRPEEQVVGVATLFTALCDTCGLDPSQLIDASRRRLRDDDNFVYTEVRALNEYIRKEVLR